MNSQPSDVNLEEVVLGAIILEKYALEKAIQILTPEMFYSISLGKIYSAVIDLVNANEPVDMMMVVGRLRTIGELKSVGGAIAISSLVARVASTANIEKHCYLLKELWLGRECIRLGGELMRDGFDTTIDKLEAIPSYIKKLQDAYGSIGGSKSQTSKDLDLELIDHIKMIDSGVTSGIPTGFRVFDELTGGLQKGDFIVIGSYSSNGKTATAINILNNTAKMGRFGKIYSLEQPNKQVYMRQVAIRSGVSSSDILKTKLQPFEKTNVFNSSIELSKEGTIYEDKLVKFHDILNDMKMEITKGKVEYFIIDYLQLIKLKGGDRRISIGDAANDLKAFAKIYEVPVILVSQLRRPTNDNDRPAMHMLKESGEIENAADIVWLPYIPFNPPANLDSYTFDGVEYDTLMDEGKLMLHFIDKGRNYGLTYWATIFNKSMKITNYEKYD